MSAIRVKWDKPYACATATSNSENVLVLTCVQQVAKTYLTHWQSRWALGTDWQSTF